MFEIKDKVIVVTGSNGLLGKELADSLRSRGAVVLGADVTFANATANDFVMDITSEASVKDTVAKMVAKSGRIDGWINNAYPRTPDWGKKLEEIPFESWQKNIDMHLNGYFLCSRIALEQMKKQKKGSLINMSSIYGHLGPDFSVYDGTEMTMPAAYSAIKGAITNFTRYLASYYGPSNVRVNTISPGGVFANQPESFVRSYEKKVPLGRMASAKDIAAAVHFLLSDDASYITGQNIIVDGGWSII